MKNAQLYYWAIVIAFSLGWFIHRQYYAPSKSSHSIQHPFQVPKVSQHRWRQPLKVTTIDYISNSDTDRYLGKFAFSDSIFIPDDRLLWSEEEFLRIDQLPYDESHGAGLQVRIDSQLVVTGRRNDKARAYHPAFIFNETQTTKYLLGMNWQPWHILEAKDPEGHWRPIQVFVPSDCATQMGYLKLEPQEFCMLSLPVFAGDFATELRLRIRNGKEVLLSNSFKGKINRTQFKFSPTDPYKWHIQQYPKKSANRFFLGSTPLELDGDK